MPAWPSTATDTVAVTVDEMEKLEVPGTTALTFSAFDTTYPAKYAPASATDSSGLKYSHNSTTAKKITATAAAGGGGNAANTITLKVAIAGQSAQAIVNAGSADSNVPLWNSIAAGGYTLDLTWTADGTLAGTQPGNYVWTVIPDVNSGHEQYSHAVFLIS